LGCLGDQHRRSDRPLALESIDRQGISTRRGPVGTVPALRAVRRSRHRPSSVLRAGTVGCVVVLVGVSLRLPWAVPWTAVPGLALLAMTPSMSVELRVRRRRWTFTATDAALATALVLGGGGWVAPALLAGAALARSRPRRSRVHFEYDLSALAAAAALAALAAATFGEVSGADSAGGGRTTGVRRIGQRGPTGRLACRQRAVRAARSRRTAGGAVHGAEQRGASVHRGATVRRTGSRAAGDEWPIGGFVGRGRGDCRRPAAGRRQSPRPRPTNPPIGHSSPAAREPVRRQVAPWWTDAPRCSAPWTAPPAVRRDRAARTARCRQANRPVGPRWPIRRTPVVLPRPAMSAAAAGAG